MKACTAKTFAAFLLLICAALLTTQCIPSVEEQDILSLELTSTHAQVNQSINLEDVQHWLYFLGFSIEDNDFDQIETSLYDLLVIDPIITEKEYIHYDISAIINRMHLAEHPKIVLAYIDIGQAEDWRAYWQSHWRIGSPPWILSADPDGWQGNYPVAYWQAEWQNIWLQDEGILDRLIAAGFDGIYLDWIEGYSDEAMQNAANKAGVDALQEMIHWVRAISNHCKSSNPQCIVIAQNAAMLLPYAEYRQAIDAIAQEQIWFDGGPDNTPPGDCPLPHTDIDVESTAYITSLSSACRKIFYDFPDGTLHSSSAEYVRNLQIALQNDLPVFTVDYAVLPSNIAWIYNTSRALGFIPFVSERSLSTYIPPFIAD